MAFAPKLSKESKQQALEIGVELINDFHAKLSSNKMSMVYVVHKYEGTCAEGANYEVAKVFATEATADKFVHDKNIECRGCSDVFYYMEEAEFDQCTE